MEIETIVLLIIGGVILLKINSRGLVARLVQIYILYVACSQFFKYYNTDLKMAIIGFLMPCILLLPTIIRIILKLIHLIKKRRIIEFEEEQ